MEIHKAKDSVSLATKAVETHGKGGARALAPASRAETQLSEVPAAILCHDQFEFTHLYLRRVLGKRKTRVLIQSVEMAI